MIIKVKAFPESRKEEIKKIKEGKYEIHLRASPVRGEANLRLIEILKEYFPEAKGIRMLSGHTRPNKTFEILGLLEPLQKNLI